MVLFFTKVKLWHLAVRTLAFLWSMVCTSQSRFLSKSLHTNPGLFPGPTLSLKVVVCLAARKLEILKAWRYRMQRLQFFLAQKFSRASLRWDNSLPEPWWVSPEVQGSPPPALAFFRGCGPPPELAKPFLCPFATKEGSVRYFLASCTMLESTASFTDWKLSFWMPLACLLLSFQYLSMPPHSPCTQATRVCINTHEGSDNCLINRCPSPPCWTDSHHELFGSIKLSACILLYLFSSDCY